MTRMWPITGFQFPICDWFKCELCGQEVPVMNSVKFDKLVLEQIKGPAGVPDTEEGITDNIVTQRRWTFPYTLELLGVAEPKAKQLFL